MNFDSIKKYAKQAVPFVAAGKSQAQLTARALVKQARGKSLSESDKATLATFDKAQESPANNKLVAHVATKLLSSREALKDPKVSAKGHELLTDLAKQSPTAKTDALHQVYSHYKNKQVQRNVAGALLGASVVTTVGTFAGAGPAGFIPLIAGVIPSATALAKSRKAGHRLDAIEKQEVTKEGHATWKKDRKAAKAAAAEAALKQAAPAQAEPKETAPAQVAPREAAPTAPEQPAAQAEAAPNESGAQSEHRKTE